MSVHAVAGSDVDAAVVALRGVTKSWSNVPLLTGVDFDVRPGPHRAGGTVRLG